MTTTIQESRAVVTLINVFEVEPQQQSDLVSVLERGTVEVMQYLEGFVSESIHRGLDGRHVAVYAQWARKQDFEAMLAHPKVQEHLRAVSALGRAQPALYHVDSICEK